MKRDKFLLYSFWLCLILGALFIRNKVDIIYALLGNYYLKHNNVTMAQDFYEKSFQKGYHNEKIRNVYVYSLINGKNTTDSQEKLVAIAEGDIQDKASIIAKNALKNMQYKIMEKYSDNYIKQAPFNQKILRWNKFPITYTFENETIAPSIYSAEIRNAFSDWENSGCLILSESTSNANIIIHFINNDKNVNFETNKKYVIAYTVPQISSTYLQNMDIYFYLKDPEGNDFTSNQIYNTALHEIFHALGFMGHSLNKKDIMYMSRTSNTNNDERASLTRADLKTLELLYKIKPDITNDATQKSEYIPYLIIGNNDKIISSKIDEAQNYINNAPSLPSGYIDLAESLVAKCEYADAIKNLEKALQLAETEEMKYIIYYNLAVSYFYTEYYEMSYGYIKKAMEIKDTDELHLLKAEIYVKQDIEKAKKEYIYLIKYNPSNPDYIIRLSNIYIKEGKYLKARQFLKYFLNKNPEYKINKRFKKYGILIW